MNALIHEKSPYLLQHAHNPVNWLPWGEEAFAKARAENKPVFLSIGYSTCHWCHVMERESFEDPQAAALLNATAVPVKVDREERPDLDALYMAFAHALTGRGGWPLSVFLTPDKKPFFAGTYFPKESGPGRIGFMDLLARVDELWKTRRQDIAQSAEDILARVRAFLVPENGDGDAPLAPGPAALTLAAETLAGEFDSIRGGFGRAPKFPSPHVLLFLLREYRRTGKPDILAMAEKTLAAMRRGGLYDHVGFGFHRYSTDADWLLPHFEKMLYDQAMLAMAYAEAFQAAKNPLYEQTALEIFEYVARDMTAPQGAFYSAVDADSEGEEGKFYVWTVDEVRKALSEEEAGLFLEVYAFKAAGNFHDEATGRQTGANIPHLEKSLAAWAGEYGMAEEELAARLEAAREKLFAARENRPRPLRDDKILTDWNGLMIAALSKAARAFGRPDLARRAARAADFILGNLRAPDGRLLRRFRDGQAAIPGHLDDYAFFIWGLTELYQADFDAKYLKEALRLADILAERFEDKERGGFFLTADDAETTLLRHKEILDGALPSGSSAALYVLPRLARLTGCHRLEALAKRQLSGYAQAAASHPQAMAMFLCGLSYLTETPSEAVIAGEPFAPETTAILDAINAAYLPWTVVALRPESLDPELAALAPYLCGMAPQDGRPAAYVCRDGACERPVFTPGETLALLAPDA